DLPTPLPSLHEEVTRFHEIIQNLAQIIEDDNAALNGITEEQLLQGPFSDAMTHAGQLAMLRRLSGSPIPPENFIVANISQQRLGPDQSEPVSPDEIWPEAPEGWKPPSRQRIRS